MSQSSLSPAVLHCCTAYEQTFALERGKGLDEYQAGLKAKEAYLKSMPNLTDRDSIRDFIACVTHAMVFELVYERSGSSLLRAAQIALRAARSESKAEKAA